MIDLTNLLNPSKKCDYRKFSLFKVILLHVYSMLVGVEETVMVVVVLIAMLVVVMVMVAVFMMAAGIVTSRAEAM